MRSDCRGFTLIEMIFVVMIMGILTAIALPQYQAAILQTKEAVLKEDLFTMRNAIDQYYAGKDKWPPSLQALVEEGYLRRLEPDPMTGMADWQEVQADPDPDNPADQPGIKDVKSSSERTSSKGSPYNEW